MLLNLHKKSWMEGLTLQNYHEHSSLNEETVKEILGLAKAYNKVSTVKGNFNLKCFRLWDEAVQYIPAHISHQSFG